MNKTYLIIGALIASLACSPALAKDKDFEPFLSKAEKAAIIQTLEANKPDTDPVPPGFEKYGLDSRLPGLPTLNDPSRRW
jgi:hypothetical protein